MRPYPTSDLWPLASYLWPLISGLLSLISDLWPLASDLRPLISGLFCVQVDEHGLPVDLPDDEQFIDTELLHGTPQARPLTTDTHICCTTTSHSPRLTCPFI